MKNILMIATYFPPMGGVGTVRVTKYVKYLKKYGWNPTVVTISEKYITNIDESLMKDVSEDVKIYKLDFKKKHKDISIDFYKALKKQTHKIINEKKYDMVFITGGPFGILPIGNYIYKKYKINYVLDLRDPFKLQTLTYNNKKTYVLAKIKRYIKGIIERKSFENVTNIFTVNDTMTEEYKEEYPKIAEKIITIPNGFDLSDYDTIKPKATYDFSIVYSGKFETAAGFRNPRILFKTIKKLNQDGYDIKFLHIGKEEKRVQDIMKQEECEEYCEYLGLKKFKETIAFCKGAGALVAICGENKNEQTGKIFDYICCEKPIIVMSKPETEINKVCKNFNNIFTINLNDEKELYNAILDIYLKRTVLTKNNLKENEFSRENLTKKLVEVLNKGVLDGQD